jgi:hypothetical protein
MNSHKFKATAALASAVLSWTVSQQAANDEGLRSIVHFPGPEAGTGKKHGDRFQSVRARQMDSQATKKFASHGMHIVEMRAN